MLRLGLRRLPLLNVIGRVAVALVAAIALTCGPRVTPVAITNVTVIDPSTGSRQTEVNVVISGNRIQSVGSETPPANAQLIDGRGKFVIPGLWDMHVHVWRPAELRTLLSRGVTGVRCMGGRVLELGKWRKQIEAGEIEGPRIIFSGPALASVNPPRMPYIRVDNEADAMAAVRGVAGSEADFIKIHDTLPRAAFFTVAEDAKRRGIPFAGHVPDGVTASEASEAGMASIEHLDGVTPDAVALLAANRTWQVPTLVSQNDLPNAMALVSAMRAAGVPLLAGTDSADFTVHDELALLVRAGLSPLEALRAATTAPLEYLGVGAVADLVVLDADPLADIANTRRVHVAIAAGRVYKN